MRVKIKELKELEENQKKHIEAKMKENQNLEEINKDLELKVSQKEENEKLSTEYLNIKNEPDRWGKKNKSFENEVEVLENQVKVLKDNIVKLENKITKIQNLTTDVENEITLLEEK